MFIQLHFNVFLRHIDQGFIISPDKDHSSTESADLFLYKNMLWVLIRSASVRHF